MAFADSFVQCVAQYGLNVDAGAVPDGQTTYAALEYLWNWFAALDQDSRTAIEAATTDAPASALLDDVAPAIPGILAAFDAATGQPLSQLVGIAMSCATQALQADTGASGQV